MARAYRKRRPARIAAIRHGVQIAFLLLNVWIGVQFYLWVRYFETAGATRYVSRPAGVEGWLPIAALMNLKLLVLSRQRPEIHPGGHVSADRVSRYLARVSQGVLQLAVPDWDAVGMVVASAAAISSAAIGRCHVGRTCRFAA